MFSVRGRRHRFWGGEGGSDEGLDTLVQNHLIPLCLHFLSFSIKNVDFTPDTHILFFCLSALTLLLTSLIFPPIYAYIHMQCMPAHTSPFFYFILCWHVSALRVSRLSACPVLSALNAEKRTWVIRTVSWCPSYIISVWKMTTVTAEVLIAVLSKLKTLSLYQFNKREEAVM